MRIETCTDPSLIYPDGLVHFVSGAGLKRDPYSKFIKKTCPHYYQEYTRLCLRKKLEAGEVYPIELDVLIGTQMIFMAVIRSTWKEALRPPLVVQCLNTTLEHAQKRNMKSLAFPDGEGLPTGWLEEYLKKTAFLEVAYLIQYPEM